jgi:ketosteroid isomerase-like protein
MSRENVEIVQRLFDAVARRDSATVLSLYHPDIDWDGTRHRWTEVMGSGGHWRGHDGLRKWSRDYYEAWESLDDTLEELIDVDERVVAVVTTRARGRGSGLEVEWAHQAGVWTVRAGRIVKVVWFPSREEALEAVRLEE